MVTNSSGALVESTAYYPYGGTRTGSITTTEEQFTGQRLDSTGLYYYGARYYDPAIGRFVSPDTIVQNYRRPASFNRYAYAFDNPLKYTDPSGNVNVSDVGGGGWRTPSTWDTIQHGNELAVEGAKAEAQWVEAKALQKGAEGIAGLARIEAERTGTIMFQPMVDVVLPPELRENVQVVQVAEDSITGVMLAGVFKTDTMTLDGLVITTRDITHPEDRNKGFYPELAIHEAVHAMDEANLGAEYYRLYVGEHNAVGGNRGQNPWEQKAIDAQQVYAPPFISVTMILDEPPEDPMLSYAYW